MSRYNSALPPTLNGIEKEGVFPKQFQPTFQLPKIETVKRTASNGGNNWRSYGVIAFELRPNIWRKCVHSSLLWFCLYFKLFNLFCRNLKTALWRFKPCKRTTLREVRNEKLLNSPYSAFNLVNFYLFYFSRILSLTLLNNLPYGFQILGCLFFQEYIWGTYMIYHNRRNWHV